MNALESFLQPGTELLRQVHGLTRHELKAKGMADKTARELVKLSEIYFGPTRNSRRQKTAQQTRHNLDTLRLLEKILVRVDDTDVRWRIRAQACASASPLEVAREAVKERAHAREPKDSVRRTRLGDGTYWNLTFTGPSETLAQVYGVIDKNRPTASLSELVFGGGTTKVRPVPQIVVHLDDLTKIVESGGEEVRLQMTNGAVISGAQLLEMDLADFVYGAIWQPEKGPINLYRTQRGASLKQRLLAAGERPICAWPGCNKPADESQVHHIRAWKYGGQTNQENLTILCSYHNGVNDDNPNAPPRRGRIVRTTGPPHYEPPHAR